MVSKKTLFFSLIIAVMASVSFTVGTHAKSANAKGVKRIADAKTQVETPAEKVNCAVEYPEKPEYAGKFLGARKRGLIEPGETSSMEVFIQNAGNVPWFSESSGCHYLITYLGTQKNTDRASNFAFLTDKNSGWKSNNRIQMTTQRVNPGETAIFTFTVQAPKEEGYYREFFAPVIENVAWVQGEALFSSDFRIGNAELRPAVEKFLPYIYMSGNLSKYELAGEKKIEVDLSEQKMWLKIGDTVLRTFPVSSGKWSTPTPTGSYEIQSKQDVRIASSSPHYIMPRFMLFRNGGYGIHSLPSLANDRGVFWTEALSHIGIPVSHGCIRLLPDDSKFAYEFADVGTKMEVHY